MNNFLNFVCCFSSSRVVFFMLFVFCAHHALVVVVFHALVVLFCVGTDVGASYIGVVMLRYILA
jgi:hypothetical protein